MEVGIPRPPAAVWGRDGSVAAGSPLLSLSSEVGWKELFQSPPRFVPGWAAPLLLLPPCCGWARGREGGTRRAQSPRKSALGGTGIVSTIHFVTKVIMCREMYG